MERIRIDGGQVEVEERGRGEPVLLIHGSLLADVWAPLLEHTDLAHGHRLITWHRLQLVHDAPQAVVTLSLLEAGGPPVPALAEFGEVVAAAERTFRAGDPARAADTFLRFVGGDGYRSTLDAALPRGGFDQVLADLGTFFDVELQARSPFDADQAAAITQPVLAMLGGRSPAFLQQGFEWLRASIPQLEAVEVAGASHLFPLEAPDRVADELGRFLTRHPMA